jgi:hypothetical protein
MSFQVAKIARKSLERVASGEICKTSSDRISVVAQVGHLEQGSHCGKAEAVQVAHTW